MSNEGRITYTLVKLYRVPRRRVHVTSRRTTTHLCIPGHDTTEIGLKQLHNGIIVYYFAVAQNLGVVAVGDATTLQQESNDFVLRFMVSSS